MKEISRINLKNTRLDPYIDKLGERLQIEEARHSVRESQLRHSFWQKFKELFTNKRYLKPLLILTSVSSSIFILFFAVFSQAQHLGFRTLQMNGIVFGISQIFGYILLLPIVARIPRKQGLIGSQIGLLTCAASLYLLSLRTQTSLTRNISGIISTFLVSSLLSAQFSFMTLLNSESFPSTHRGMSVGLILSMGKVIVSSAPYISHWAREKHLHVLVGCSFLLLPALILTIFLKETLQTQPDPKPSTQAPETVPQSEDNMANLPTSKAEIGT